MLRILPIFFVVGISLALVPTVLVMETVGRVEYPEPLSVRNILVISPAVDDVLASKTIRSFSVPYVSMITLLGVLYSVVI